MFYLINKSTQKLVLVLGALFMVGCAPAPLTPKSEQQTSSTRNTYRYSASALSTTSNSGHSDDYYCPNSENILLYNNMLNGGYDYSGRGSFKACTGRSNASEFSISGVPWSNSMCVFPMQRQSNGLLVLIATPQCVAMQANVLNNPVRVSFPSSVNINFLMIVDWANTEALHRCISGGSGGQQACPPHAEGAI